MEGGAKTNKKVKRDQFKFSAQRELSAFCVDTFFSFVFFSFIFGRCYLGSFNYIKMTTMEC